MGGTSKPVRVMLIRGKCDSLLGMDIIQRRVSEVNFGSKQFKVGKSGWGMVTLNANRHLVCPLVPTASDYAKLNGYFRQLRDAKIEVLNAQGDFGGNLSARGDFGRKQRMSCKMGSFAICDFRNGGNGPKYDVSGCVYYFGFSAWKGNAGNCAKLKISSI